MKTPPNDDVLIRRLMFFKRAEAWRYLHKANNEQDHELYRYAMSRLRQMSTPQRVNNLGRRVICKAIAGSM